MINYIICTDNDKKIQLYKKIINNYMNNKNCNYKIIINTEENIKNIVGKNIYFLDINESINLAKEIRYNGDWDSQIIVTLNNHNKSNNIDLFKLKKLFAFDVLFNYDNWLEKIKMYLDINYNILNRNKTLCYKYCNEIFIVSYNDINYIEKNLGDNYSTIVTDKNKYIINLSINKLMEIFNNDSRFYKCHRSCIVNINNIIGYDITNNIIKFCNENINLVSRDRKKELESILMNKY